MGLKYIPKQGDICYVNFSPIKGHEQSGMRPAIVISNNDYIKLTNMVIICPITSNEKLFPTHYNLLSTKIIKGSVLCEHIRSIDYKARNVSFVEKINKDEFLEILDIINSLLEL